MSGQNLLRRLFSETLVRPTRLRDLELSDDLLITLLLLPQECCPCCSHPPPRFFPTQVLSLVLARLHFLFCPCQRLPDFLAIIPDTDPLPVFLQVVLPQDLPRHHARLSAAWSDLTPGVVEIALHRTGGGIDARRIRAGVRAQFGQLVTAEEEKSWPTHLELGPAEARKKAWQEPRIKGLGPSGIRESLMVLDRKEVEVES